MTPVVRKFPVGQLAVYLGFLPDVEYSVENRCADGQRAGVIVFVFMDGQDLQDLQDDFDWFAPSLDCHRGQRSSG